MIYYGFKNYEEFKSIFGIVEHGNGVKSRKNKILLSLLKDRSVLHQYANPEVNVWQKEACRKNPLTGGYVDYTRWVYETSYKFGCNILECTNMDDLRLFCHKMMKNFCGCYTLELNGKHFFSNVFSTDDFKGVCEDGDENSIRYVNHSRDGRVFKMKAGKFFRKLIEEDEEFNAMLSEPVKIWLCEQFAEDWKAYASQFQADYDLHVDDEFELIYDGYYLDGCFHSCMVDKGYHDFYEKAVSAKAAYLTKKNDGVDRHSIVARCVIYTDVHVCGEDKTLRLAERQYATDGSDKLKRQLIMALIEAGEIDGYKRIGADCGDSRGFVDIHGNSLPSTDFWIPCDIIDCSVSYQDSFKYYNEENGRAYNSSGHHYTDDLATTDGGPQRENDCWSDYNQEYINEDDAYFVDTRDDYFYADQVVAAHVYNSHYGRFSDYTEYCFENDCIEIDGEYYYAGHDSEDASRYGIYSCPECGDWFFDGNGCYSELTGDDYCCSDCMYDAEKRYHKDNGDVYSDYDDGWYAADEVVVAQRWMYGHKVGIGFCWSYKDYTISIDSLDELIEDGQATYVNGVAYIDDIGCDGEPVHFCAADLRAA